MSEVTVALIDGEARMMGEGICVVIQEGPDGVVDVVLQRADLEALLAAM
jgi:hypothetical protein